MLLTFTLVTLVLCTSPVRMSWFGLCWAGVEVQQAMHKGAISLGALSAEDVGRRFHTCFLLPKENHVHRKQAEHSFHHGR